MRKEITAVNGYATLRDPRMLPDTVGVVAQNIKGTRGDVRPWRVPLDVADVPANRQSLYRMGRDTPSDSSYWLSWTTRVNVMRAFVATDPKERTIFTGSGTPKWTDNILGLAGAPYPTTSRELGVPTPATGGTLTLNVDGVTGTAQLVYAVETFVNELGEEGPPGPPSNGVNAKPGATLTLSALAAAPAGTYGVTKRRIYCTKSGNTSTDFFLAAEVLIGATSAAIDLAALNDVLATEDYDMPPADGHSLTPLWYSMAAMLSGKSLRFCEPGLIYAWPEKYKMLLDDTGVAIGTFDQTIVVLTTGKPRLFQGQDPAAMSEVPHQITQACVSARSVVNMADSVIWAAPDGLMSIGSRGAAMLTAGIFEPDDWKAMNPSTMVGFRHKDLYGVLYNDGTGVKGLLIDPANPIGAHQVAANYEAAFTDPISSQLYFAGATNVYKWDAGASPMTTTFRSKVFHERAPVGWAAYQLIANSYANTTIKGWCNGVLKWTIAVTDGKPHGLPGGFTGADWQFEVSGTDPWQALLLADDIAELDWV